jgi:hypothetical protein
MPNDDLQVIKFFKTKKNVLTYITKLRFEKKKKKVGTWNILSSNFFSNCFSIELLESKEGKKKHTHNAYDGS